jgi:uncharacterized protein (TIGR04255 family)
LAGDEDVPSYPNAPLAVVVVEVRFPEQPEAVSRRAQSVMRAAVRDELPLVENVTENQVQVALGAPIPASVQKRTFPRFVTRDRTTALVVNDSAMILETTRYAGYGSFRPLVEAVVDAVDEAVRPDGVARVGLRYIDEIRVPGITSLPGDWHGYIDDHLLAAVDLQFLPEALTPQTWQGLVQFSTGQGTTLALRYGPGDGYAFDPRGPTRRKYVPPPGAFFLLDSDSFWMPYDEVPEFAPATVMEICDRLHAPVRAMFQAAVTDKLRDEVFSVSRGEKS